MIVLFDANFIMMMFDENARAPIRKDRPPIPDARIRIEHLVDTLSRSKSKIVLPAPALCEFLLMAPNHYQSYLAAIKKRSVFEVAPFDDACIVELVEQGRKQGKPRRADRQATWAKLKYDRQILAIARVHRVSKIYSTDDAVRQAAGELAIASFDLHDLPEPPPRQSRMFAEPSAALAEEKRPAKKPEK